MIRRILVFLALLFAAFFIRRWADQPAADQFLANLKNITEDKGTKIAQIDDTTTGEKVGSEGLKGIIIDTLSDKSDGTTGNAENDAYLLEKILEQDNLENNKQTQTGSELNSATNKAPGSSELENNQQPTPPPKPIYPSMMNPAPSQPMMLRPAPTKPTQTQTITIKPTPPQVKPQPIPTPPQPQAKPQPTTVTTTSSTSSTKQTSGLSSQDRTQAEQVLKLFQ